MEKKYVYYDVKQAPFKVYGLDESSKDEFRRIPKEVAEATSQGVVGTYNHTAGGRVRFTTDSKSVSIKVKHTKRDIVFYHAAPLMSWGYDIYWDQQKGTKYLGTFYFAPDSRDEYTSSLDLPEGEKELTLNMPLYGDVISLEIGIEEGATLSEHTPYAHELPIVFYGSSITQGGCVSRPGKLYSAIISRQLDTNFKCLGFSGSAKGEDAIVNYMASLPMAAFVSDYDHNAPTVEHLQKTHYKLYEAIRKAHPDIPYFMVTLPNFDYSDTFFERRKVIMESYVKAYNNGDRNVYFIDGSMFFSGAGDLDCTVDGIHPTDDGQNKMAEYIKYVIEKVMKY